MFKGLGNLGDMGKMLAKAQELQSEMGNMTQELDNMQVEADAGAGLVKVVATGKGNIKSIDIDSSLMQEAEKGVLEDLVMSAVNSAKEKAETMSQTHMQQLSEKFGIPMGKGIPGL